MLWEHPCFSLKLFVTGVDDFIDLSFFSPFLLQDEAGDEIKEASKGVSGEGPQ